MNTSINGMKVKTYRISTDEWQAGSFQTCCDCGRVIRNVTEINGMAYGTKCAERAIANMQPVEVVTLNVTPITDINRVVSPLRRSILLGERSKQLRAIASQTFESDGHISVLVKHWSMEKVEEVIARTEGVKKASWMAIKELKLQCTN